jgi:YVTN family beta-propeller protein
MLNALSKNRGSLLSLLLTMAFGFGIVPSANARTEQTVGNFPGGALLPTGQTITPSAAPGSTFAPLSTGLRPDGSADAQGAVSTKLSPDGKTLLVLTSGYNLNFRQQSSVSTPITYPVLDPTTGLPSAITTGKAEWVFVFDVSTGKLVKQQQINIPNTYNGLSWAADGQRFYVSGGIDDRVYVYKLDGDQFVPDAPFILLGHNSDQDKPFPKYDGGLLKGTVAGTAVPALSTGAAVAGLAVSQDGKTLVTANLENDSISIVDAETRQVSQEVKFFQPGGDVATGEFPFDVVIKSNSDGSAEKVFVTSQRDDEVLAVDVASQAVTRIPVGHQPNKLILSADQSLAYIANGNSDDVSVIDTNSNQVVDTIPLYRKGEKYKGANVNSLALSPDGKTLYATLGGENAVAVVNLANRKVVGRIPTGWYPNSVSVSADGNKLFVVNAKSNIGPAPAAGRTTAAGTARNPLLRVEYTWALEKAGISVIPVPDKATLAYLSKQVDQNNGFQNRRKDKMMTFLNKKIKHVVYIVKENRTYDQVLGDLPVGNGDPSLTVFPEKISPNHHKLSLDFVTFDNFYDSAESSGVGWSWSTFGRTTDYTEKHQSVLYGNAGFAGLTYDYEGTNRNINMALPQTGAPNQISTRPTGILDASGGSSILPGEKDVNAPSGDGEMDAQAIGGYLWDAALRGGKTVRNYGFFVDGAYYDTTDADVTKPSATNPLYIPISRTPFADGIPQAPPVKTALKDATDIYFRGYDQKISDIYLYEEYLRDLEQNGLPNLTLIRLPHDHFGAFNQAVAGLGTPELQMADNDYAIGKVVETLSKRPEWESTAVFIIEDDSQNGPDHVDPHRSLAYIISPYTRRNALVSTNYNTVSMIRTMEDILGIGYLGITDANAEAMSDAFTQTPDFSPYTAIIPGNLCLAPVDTELVPDCNNAAVIKSAAMPLLHDVAWWSKKTEDFFFGKEDSIDSEKFNQIVWTGIRGEQVAYPIDRSGLNLRANRPDLLKRYGFLNDKQQASVEIKK